MSKTPTGPKELALRAQREAKHERAKVPYAGKPKHGRPQERSEEKAMTPEEAALLDLIDGNRRIKGLRGKAKVPYVGTPLGNEGSEKYLM